MRNSSPYDAYFYSTISSGSETAARSILPLVYSMVQPRSVIDVGCGDGTWLRVAQELGAQEILGVEGDWSDSAALKIPQDRLRIFDLSERFDVPERFDMAVSLEVAEHLPDARSQSFVKQLTALAPVVLFSAAVPGQGGTGHRNERWQDQWAALFAGEDYHPVDVVRPALWAEASVAPWYLQNTFLYAGSWALEQFPILAKAADEGLAFPMRVVHPRMLELVATEPSLTIGRSLRRMPGAVKTTIRNRLQARRLR